MKLYYSPGSCAMCVHIVLEEAGFKFDTEKVDLRAPRTPEYLKLNPKGYVPALVTDDAQVLTEAQVILQYLADQKPEKNLLPKPGTWERYKALETLNFVATEIHKGLGPLWKTQALTATPDAAEHLRKAVVDGLAKRFDTLSETLKTQPFLLGSTFSVADAYLFTVLGWTKMLKVDMAKWPVLLGFCERVAQRPAVQSAMKAEGLI